MNYWETGAQEQGESGPAIWLPLAPLTRKRSEVGKGEFRVSRGNNADYFMFQDLRGRVAEQRQKEVSRQLFPPQIPAMSGMGLFQNLSLGAGSCGGEVLCHFVRFISMEQDWKWSKWDSNCHSYGMPAPQMEV